MANNAARATRKLRDDILRRQLLVGRFARGTELEARTILIAAERQLIAQMRDAFALGLSTTRIEALLASIRRIGKEGFAAVQAAIERDLIELMNVENAAARKAASRFVSATYAGDGGKALSGRIAERALHLDEAMASRLLRTTPFAGSTVAEWFGKKYPAKLADGIATAVRAGLFAGQTPAEILRGLRGKKAVIASTRREALTLVSSMHASMASQVSIQTWESMPPDLVTGWEWDATLDELTCPLCGPRDGKAYDREFRPVGHALPWQGGPGSIHIACRCAPLPRLQGDVLPPKEPWEEWIKRQPRGVMEEALGKQRADLVLSGKVSVRDLWGDRGRVLSVKELKKLA